MVFELFLGSGVDCRGEFLLDVMLYELIGDCYGFSFGVNIFGIIDYLKCYFCGFEFFDIVVYWDVGGFVVGIFFGWGIGGR